MKNSPNHQHTSIRILSPQADDIWGVIENNLHFLPNPKCSASLSWDWEDDCGLQLTQMDPEWFAHIRAGYYGFLCRSDLPLLTESEFQRAICCLLERLPVRIPADSLLAERLSYMTKAHSREMQSLLFVLAERTYVYTLMASLHCSPEAIQKDLNGTLQVLTSPIWRHDVFGS